MVPGVRAVLVSPEGVTNVTTEVGTAPGKGWDGSRGSVGGSELTHLLSRDSGGTRQAGVTGTVRAVTLQGEGTLRDGTATTHC